MTKKIRATGNNNYWRDYKKKYKNNVTEKEYRVIIDAYTMFIIDKLLKGHSVTLPARIGVLCIRSWEQKIKIDKDGKILNRKIAWAKTRAYWRENPEAAHKVYLYCNNYHSINTVSKIMWDKNKVLERQKMFFTFNPARSFKNLLFQEIIKGQEYETRFSSSR
ncbi:MAG TPA: hypothetical protein PLN85_02250 [archaeon]|nr:hypothetical protein [archaeon]HRT03400.1 hypothetical protein [Candidatus Diapherotrites archaeon]